MFVCYWRLSTQEKAADKKETNKTKNKQKKYKMRGGIHPNRCVNHKLETQEI
jgi:hypothetical protein